MTKVRVSNIQFLFLQEVRLPRTGGSLGFSIIGGTDHSCIPFGGGEPGVFVSHVVPGGVAAASGKLQFGDRIEAVNGQDVTKLTHQDVVMALLADGDELVLTVAHDPPPDGYQVSSRGTYISHFRTIIPVRRILQASVLVYSCKERGRKFGYRCDPVHRPVLPTGLSGLS